MPTEQKVEQAWETPSLEEIPKISKMHVEAMEQTDDDMVLGPGRHEARAPHDDRPEVGGSRTRSRSPTWNDPDGNRIVVASYAGARWPPHAWYLNLADRDANPRVPREGGKAASSPRCPRSSKETTTSARGALLVEDRAWYADYQAKTDRRIPLVRLPETPSA